MDKKNENNNNVEKVEDSLNYILINHKNTIEEVDEDTQSKQLVEFANSLAIHDGEDIGKGINKFFNQILPENKEEDVLKINIAISNKMSKLKDKKEIINKSLNEIIKKEETTNIVLTSDLSQNISNVLSSIFHKIKKRNKIKTYDEFIQQTYKYDSVKNNILKKFLVERETIAGNSKNIINKSCIIDNRKSSPIFKKSSKNYGDEFKLNKSLKNINNDNLLQQKNNTFGNIDNNYIYEYNEKKYDDRDDILPVEIHILKRKFQSIKKIKLILYNSSQNNHNNSVNNFNKSYSGNLINSPNKNTLAKEENFINRKNSFKIYENLTSKDVQNNIYVLLNIVWLFPELLELEIDLTNDNIIKDQILLYQEKLKLFSKKIGHSLKSVYYPPPNFSNKKNNLDPLKESNCFTFCILHDENPSFDEDLSFSLDIQEDEISPKNNNSSIIPRTTTVSLEENVINESEKFMNKYTPALQMIIIYGFFISKLTNVCFCNFIIPFNLEDEIIILLKKYNIFFSEFHFTSFLCSSKMNIFQITLKFNSLDTKIFEEIINLLFKSDNLRICRLKFFPDEYYLQNEILFKLLESTNPYYKNLTSKNIAKRVNQYNKYKLEPNQELESHLLGKLTENFENNMTKFFQVLKLKNSLNELFLLFDIPNLLNKNDYFIIIIIKFLLNLFILIDESKLDLLSFIIKGKNLSFDNRKFPFLSNFFDQINIYNNKQNKINSFTFQVYFANIFNIYRIIPYNICELSIGEFDYETFEYFTEFITSSEFSLHSKLNKLQINLNNNFLILDDNTYALIIKLFTEYPKGLKELALYTSFKITYNQLEHLLLCTNYNTIENIFLNFDRGSLSDENGYGNLGNGNLDPVVIDSDKIENNDEKFFNLYYVKRNTKIKTTDFICNSIMAPISNKYNNKEFMNYNIFLNLEKFICTKEKKKYIIQFKLSS